MGASREIPIPQVLAHTYPPSAGTASSRGGRAHHQAHHQATSSTSLAAAGTQLPDVLTEGSPGGVDRQGRFSARQRQSPRVPLAGHVDG